MNNHFPTFRNQTIKKHTSNKFNFNTPKNNSDICKKQKVFLAVSLKKNFKNSNEKKESKANNRYNYNNYDINTYISKNNYFTPRYNLEKEIKFNNNRESNINIFKSIDNKNEKSFIFKNNIIEYNEIISLLDKIIKKLNSYNILIKIKNFIKELISNNHDSINEEHSFRKDYLLPSKKRPLVNQKDINNNENKENTNKEEINKSKQKNWITKDIEVNNHFLERKIKKLYHKMNELEKKNKIEQLKYLFFIIEQEKKIAELEKDLDNKKIPLDERIIDKMKEIKCYPNYYKPKLNEETDISRKPVPLSGKIRTRIPNSKFSSNIIMDNSFKKSRNKTNRFINYKYSFDKEIEFIPKKNQSQIISEDKEENNNSKNINKAKNLKIDNINDMSEIKKLITQYFSKSVNQSFNEKNFLISHPKLKYVKDSQEKNHFQQLKAKEQCNGVSHFLSNIKLVSKHQKSTINDFSYFINNSMVNVEKLKGYHNYINIENKYEEKLRLKRKASM